MAKKESAYPPAKTGRDSVLKDEAKPAGHPSALLDTRDLFASPR
jgi:hypothetical protein